MDLSYLLQAQKAFSEGKARFKSLTERRIMDPGLFLAEVVDNESTESVGFLNDLVAHIWPYINHAVSKLIIDIVEPMFEDLLPGPFKSTKFKKVDLGSTPMHFDRIDVLSRTQEAVNLQVDVSWNGKVDIKLQSPLVGSYGVKKMKLTGRLSIVMKPLIRRMPVISCMQLGFINPPTIELDFTGIADIADVSVAKDMIRKIITNIIGGLLVLPNRLLVPIDPGNNFFDTYLLPIGVLRLSLESGRDFKNSGRLIRDIPDLYLKAALGNEKMVKTKTIKNENSPEWNESFDFIYSDQQQNVHIHVWDSDLNGDDNMGGIIFPVEHILESEDQRVEVPIKKDGEEVGAFVTVSAQVMKFSTLSSNFDRTPEESSPDQIFGMLSVIVAGADHIPDHPDLAPYCTVKIGEDKEVKTPVVTKAPGIDPRTPSFNYLYNLPLTYETFEAAPSVEFELFTGTHSLGSETIEFGDVLESHEMKLQKDIKMEHGAVLNVCVQLSSLSS